MVKILYAEDDESVRVSYCRLFKAFSYEYVAVEDGTASREKILSDEHFDVFVTDGDMPGYTGEELLSMPEVARIGTRILRSGRCKEMRNLETHWEIPKTIPFKDVFAIIGSAPQLPEVEGYKRER